MMTEEFFRTTLGILIVMLYLQKHGLRFPAAWRLRSKRKPALERWVQYTSELWAFVLVFYVSGVQESILHWNWSSIPLPFPLRRWALGAMVLLLPLLWWIQGKHGQWTQKAQYILLFLTTGLACLASANWIVVVGTVPVAIVFFIRMRRVPMR